MLILFLAPNHTIISDIPFIKNISIGIINDITLFTKRFTFIKSTFASSKRFSSAFSLWKALITGIDDAKKGLVEFKNVCFKYPDADTETLTDISFTAEPGKTTAIIGSTGSGKSTIVNLIPRFYDVTGGELCIDGVNVKDVSQKSLRDTVLILWATIITVLSLVTAFKSSLNAQSVL